MISTQDFLRSFGSPLVLTLADVKGANSFKGWSNHNLPNVLFDVNKQYPYGMFFTPNGNYGSLQREGQKISRSQTLPGTKPWFNALVVDVDLNKSQNYKDKESLRAHIDSVILAYGIPPTYIVESGGGFHIYRIIKEEDRQGIQDIYGAKTLEVSMYLASLFDGGDPQCPASRDVNGLIRLPGTNHRKTSKPIPVNIVYAELKDQIGITAIEHALKQIAETQKAIVSNKDISVNVGTKSSLETNAIPMTEIIAKLHAYPRLWNGQHQTFRLDGTHLCVIDDKGGVNRTDGYRYWPEKNCINCFTDAYHPIDERPQGAVFPFLFHYFHRNITQVKKFLGTEFGVVFDDLVKNGAETVIQTFSGDDYFVELTNKRAIMHKTVKSGKKSVDVHEDIFRKPFEIIGKSWVKFHPNGTECDDEQMVYVMRINNELKLLYRLPTKKRFNEKYSGYLWFYGEDNDLGLWYEAMDKTEIPTIQVTVLNGIYPDCAILGGKAIRGDGGARFITPTFEFRTKKSNEIPLLEFYEMLTEIYAEEIALPIFLQSIALAGMNMWEGTTVYPAILVTGRTGSGKSSIAEIMKNMLGYAINDRKIALPQITPQPFKIMATDNSILFCDELTLHVNERVEESIRNIINKDKGGRGIGAENAHYNFRAPLFFTGERTFKDESLNNRMVAVIMNEKYRQKGGYDKIANIKDYSCIDAVYSVYAKFTGDINAIQQSWVSKIVKAGIAPRNADVRSYIFVINEVFELGFDDNHLLSLAKKHLENMGFGKPDEMTDEGELQMYLSRALFTRQALCVKEQYKYKAIYRFMFMNDDVYQKARGTFTSLINALNSRGERIKVGKTGLTVEVRETNAEPIDFVLEKITDFVLACNYKNIQYVNRESEEGSDAGY